MTYVVELASATTDVAGPKMARLAQLISHGIDVPAGFVVTAHAYQRCTDIDPATTSRNTSRHERLDAELRDQISTAYARLCGGVECPVAVRSSSLEEDGARASFAGAFDSFLGLRGVDSVMGAVQDCWAGLHSDHASTYRERHGAGAVPPSMAVGVMTLVPARASGVAFSLDPVTGRDDRLIIEATWGFGEPVVHGVISPDRIEVSAADGQVVRYQPGDKKIARVYDEEHRMHTVKVPAARAQAAALNTEETTTLARRIQEVATLAGRPVDCEWVLDESRRIWIVQWRPVTALPAAAPLRWDPAEYAARYAFRTA